MDDIQLDTIQKLYWSILISFETVLKGNSGIHLSKEIVCISPVFTLFCPTPVYNTIQKFGIGKIFLNVFERSLLCSERLAKLFDQSYSKKKNMFTI